MQDVISLRQVGVSCNSSHRICGKLSSLWKSRHLQCFDLRLKGIARDRMGPAMTIDRREQLLTDFASWAETEAISVDLNEASRILQIHRDTLRRANPRDWRIDDISSLLLDSYPQRHPHAFGPPSTVAATLRALLNYLMFSGNLRHGRERHLLLIAELDRVERAYPRTLVRLGESDNPQKRPPYRFVIEPDPRMELPMILARSSPLLSGAIELSEWVGNQRPTLESRELDIAAAAAAIADLGLGPAPDSAQHPNSFPALRKRWLLARALGLIRVNDEGCTASTTLLDWLRDDPENVLDLWCDAFDVVIGGRLHREITREMAIPDVVRTSIAVNTTIDRLECSSLAESDVDQIIAAAIEVASQVNRTSDVHTIRRVLTMLLDELTELGAIVRDADTLTITELGRLGKQRKQYRDEMEAEEEDDDGIDWYPPDSKAS